MEVGWLCPEDISIGRISGVSCSDSFWWDFADQLCRGSSEGAISAVAARRPLAVSRGSWKWKDKAPVF